MIEEIVTTYVFPAIASLLAGFCAYIGAKIKKLYEEKVNTEEKKKIVTSTVSYIEQVYKDIHGEEKLDKCKEKAVEWLNEKGLSISDIELDILIEAAVNGLNGKGSQND